MARELRPEGCWTSVYGDRGFSSQCQKKPTVTRDGKQYCTIHDPEYIKQKRTERNAKGARESIEKTKRWAIEGARRQATEGLTLAELERVTPDLIRKVLREEQSVLKED